MGSVNPAHEARISGEMDVLQENGYENLFFILAHGEPAALPESWRESTWTTDEKSPRRMITETVSWIDKHNVDVVHLHTLRAVFVGGIAVRFTKRRPQVVYEIHGALAFESMMRHGGINGFLRFLVLYCLEWLAVLLSDRLLLVSDKYTTYYPIALIRSRTVVPRVLTHEDAARDMPRNPTASLRQLLEYTQSERKRGRTLLVYSGGLSRWQQIEKTVSLMAECIERRSASGVIITPHREKALKVVQQYVKERGRILVVTLPREEVLHGLAACDVGILLREDVAVNHIASPTKFFEYLHAGIYVITTVGAATVSPIVMSCRAGLVLNDNDTAQATGWIDSVRLDESERLRIRELARENYTWESYEDRLLSLYSHS